MSIPTEGKMPNSVLGALNMLSRANARYTNFLQELLAASGDSHFPTDLDELERKAAAQIKRWSGRVISLSVSGYVPHPTITPDIAVHFIRLMASGCTADQAARQQALSLHEAHQMEIDYKEYIRQASRRVAMSRDEYLQDLLNSWRKH